MNSFITSYVGLFAPVSDEIETGIERIEIPLIQRDYAQGRVSADVAEIRADFLDVLCGAVEGNGSVGLDFVYGDVHEGTFRPLDGQQRLTTLFLLHWYVAFRTSRLSVGLPWTQFRYATRASAEMFCERIVERPPPADVDDPAGWLTDQSWYLHVWRHDSTIQAMQVMIRAIDARLRGVDLERAWMRLVDDSEPAISFHVLPIEEIGAGDELYIKMNSRGKPLTPFENFKARFEKALEGSPRAADFADRVDGAWSDVFWRYRGVDDLVDDKFVRYFSFVTELMEWRDGTVRSGRLEPRAERVFGHRAPNGPENLDFLFNAFDAWVDVDVKEVFESLITNHPSAPGDKVRFFGSKRIDHFHACCDTYAFGRKVVFGWAETLTLYAVLLHRIHGSPEFVRRLRVLRNLLEASTNELRVENMPALVRAVELLVVSESLDQALAGLDAFNEAQIDDERAKAAILASHPHLTDTVFTLEDHRLLRGSLVAFDLDAERLGARASCFETLMADRRLWPALTAALLAIGDYARRPNLRSFRFGSPTDDRWWRELLTGTKRSNLRGTSVVLARLLDTVADSDRPSAEILRQVRSRWLDAQDAFDWRYYLVKYDAMREGKSGIYFAEGGEMGFRLCMLDKTQLNSWYRDPFLLAVWRDADVSAAVRDPWFTGYETAPRWITLKKSGVRMRCIDNGFLLDPPPEAAHRHAFDEACAALGVGEDHVLRLPQTTRDGMAVDTDDRIEVGAGLLKSMVSAGL